MDQDKYTDALRRIATAIIDWDRVTQTPDTERLTAKYDRYCDGNPGWTIREAEIEATVGFMAEVLAKADVIEAFTCPKCGGHHFGGSIDKDTHKVLARQCHDEFNRGCHWSGTAPDEGMNYVEP